MIVCKNWIIGIASKIITVWSKYMELFKSVQTNELLLD